MIKLFPHQEEAINETKGFHNIGVYHDMGLGKTFTGSEMMKRFDCKVNLIVCQKSKVQDWVEHFTEYYRMQVFDLTVKSQLAEFHGLSQDERFYIVGIINYELAWRRKELLDLKEFTLMLDESSLIQNQKAKQTKFILKMQPAHVILLSGTPVGGKYENLWSQMHLLGWNITETLYNKQYVNWKKIDSGGFTHKIVDKDDPYKNVERLKKKMREHGAIFKKTEECFDLPEQVFTEIKVKAPKEYWKFLKNEYIVIDGMELIGDTSLTKLLYSRQICSQYNKEKIEAFNDLVASTTDRLIVFYNFNEELYQLKKVCEELGRPISEINGHMKDLTAYEQESDSITLCQYQSASKGLNLQKCNRIVYFSLTLSSEDFEQSKKRIHRIGQKNTCFYYLMICRGTVEEQILKNLKERKDFTDDLFKE
ncbi:MAG: DEAD/DEAH box helicase [Eubacteriales bacterium]|nr:DEAD/DEAH box helicase [Eubacteriales bacterium]